MNRKLGSAKSKLLLVEMKKKDRLLLDERKLILVEKKLLVSEMKMKDRLPEGRENSYSSLS